jgi:ATP-binding cassette, subfamily B, bacterial
MLSRGPARAKVGPDAGRYTRPAVEPEPVRPPAPPRPWARTLRYLRPHRARALAVIALALLSAAAGSLILAAPKLLIDHALARGDLRAIALLAGGVLLLGWGGFALDALASRRASAVCGDVLLDIRLALYRHLLALGPRFAGRAPLGEVVSRVDQAVAEVERAASEAAAGLATRGLFLAATLGILAWLSPLLLLVNLPLLAVAVLLHRRLLPKAREASRALRERTADIGSSLVETVLGVRAVISARAEEREAARFREKNRAFAGALLRAQGVKTLGAGVPGAILALGGAATLLVGGPKVVEGEMTLGTLVAVLACQARLFPLLASLLRVGLEAAAARPSLGRILGLLDRKVEVAERLDAKPLPSPRGALAFEGVVLSPGRGEPALRGLSFEVAPGETVALVGPGGAGRAAAADLCQRLSDPESGRVRLDGADLRSLRVCDVRAAVAVVSQETFLFRATIEENVRYAKLDSTPEELRAAIQGAELEEACARLPEGARTRVGEGGVALGGEERSRVAIARALLQEPAVVVLDDPTAHLVEPAEARLLPALSRLMKGRTTLLVSQRSALVALADRVVLLDGGRASVVGPPRTLARTAESFRKLFPELAGASL